MNIANELIYRIVHDKPFRRDVPLIPPGARSGIGTFSNSYLAKDHWPDSSRCHQNGKLNPNHVFEVFGEIVNKDAITIRKEMIEFVDNMRVDFKDSCGTTLTMKGTDVNRWIERMKNNDEPGDEICIYLLGRMSFLHTVVLTGDGCWTTMDTTRASSATELIQNCRIHLLYLGKNCFALIRKRPNVRQNISAQQACMQRFAINPRTNRGRQPRPLNLVTRGRGRTPPFIQRAAITPIARFPQSRAILRQRNREYRPFNVPPMLPVNTQNIPISAVLNTSISSNVMKVNSPEVAAVLSSLRSSSKDKCTQIKHPEVADVLANLLKPRPAKTPETEISTVINVASDSDDSCIEEVSNETPAMGDQGEIECGQHSKHDTNTTETNQCNTDDASYSDAVSVSQSVTQTKNLVQTCDNIQKIVSLNVTDNSIVNTVKPRTKEPGEISSGDDCDTSDTTADVMDSLDLGDPLLDETLSDYTRINKQADTSTDQSKRELNPVVPTTSANMELNDVKHEQSNADTLSNVVENDECRETPLSILNRDLQSKEIKQELIDLNDNISATKGEMYQQLVRIECKLEHNRLTEDDVSNWLLKERENLEPGITQQVTRSKPQVAKKRTHKLSKTTR